MVFTLKDFRSGFGLTRISGSGSSGTRTTTFMPRGSWVSSVTAMVAISGDVSSGGDGADGRGQCDVAPSQDQHVIASSGLCGAHQDRPDDHQDVVQEKSAFPEQDGDVITIISNLRPLILTTCRAWRRRRRQRCRPSCRRCRRSRRRRTR